MPRRPTYEHDFTKRDLNPVLETVRREYRLAPSPLLRPYLTYQLPRIDSEDSLQAAVAASGHLGELRYLHSVDEMIDILQTQPVIVGLNWYDDFNWPSKHPFRKARREF